MWVSAVTQNTEADSFIRNFSETIESKLSTQLFQKISYFCGNPFASRINHQNDRHISWKPDPETIAIDVFSIKQNTEFYYIFPPFSLLGKMTAKICSGITNAIVVILKWSSQQWYPSLSKKPDEKHDRSTISKKFSINPGSTKRLYTTSKASPASLPD